MTAPKPMTRHELLELAALDALGLLDDYEALLYTRSFHQAPAGVQDELVELQARIASDPSLLSDEEPDSDLRTRVINYVMSEVEKASPDLMPIAKIGRNHAAGAASAAGIADPNEPRDVVARIGGSSTWWRVATFVLCGVVVVMAYFLSESVNQHHRIATLALDANTVTQLERQIGPTVKEFLFDATTKAIVLRDSEGLRDARAVLLVREGMSEGLLVMEHLPFTANEDYELSVRDTNGRLHRLARFAGTEALSGVRVLVSSVAFTPGASWEINGPDGVLLLSA